MKNIILILISLFLLQASKTYAQESYSREQIDSMMCAHPITGVKTILDSFEIIKQIGGIVDGFKYPPTIEEIRLNRIVYSMFKLPFKESEKLLKDKSNVAKAHAFLILVKAYPSKITNKHLEIFKDNSKLYRYSPDGIEDAQMTLGAYCRMIYESEAKENTQ